MTTTKRKQRNIILPQQVIDKIRSNATTEREAEKGLSLVNAVYGRAIFNKFDLNEWFDVPYQTLKGVSFEYNKYLHLLKGVIEFNGSWYNPANPDKKGYPQKARFILGGYHITDFRAVPIAAKPQPQQSSIEQQATAIYKRLSLKIGSDILTEKTPFFRASLIIAKYLTATLTEDYFFTNGKHIKPIYDNERLPIANWVYNSELKKWCLKKQVRTVNGKEFYRTMTGAKYKELCAYHEATPIRYKKLYVIGATDKRQFATEKLKDIQESAFFTLNAIRTGDYIPHRNETNIRMDYAFTALMNILSDIILCSSQPLFCQDLSNSQFTILARLMLNSFEGKTQMVGIDTKDFVKAVKGFELSEDVKRFCETAAKGTLYDDFAQQNGLSREDAKEVFMFVAFSKNSTPHRFKEVFNETYPSVYGIIQQFKAMQGHEQLPILLQRIESSLFVDCILGDCLKNRLEVLTKHDSIYFTAKSSKKAIEIMTKHLDRHLINYNLKK